MTIKSLPKRIPNAPEYLEVRGEVYMSFNSFDALTRRQEENEEKTFKIHEMPPQAHFVRKMQNNRSEKS